MDKLSLILGLPLRVGDIKVYQPLISDIEAIGEEQFSQYCLPYTLSVDSVFDDDIIEQNPSLADLTNLELFFLQDQEGRNILDSLFGEGKTIEVLSDSLKYFLHCSEIKPMNNIRKLMIDNSYTINNELFEDIREAVKTITAREDLEIERPPKNMSKRQKDIWLKLQKGRKRKAEKDKTYLQDMINVVKVGKESYVPSNIFLQMTYWELHNEYKNVIVKSNYESSMDFKLSQKYDVKDEVKHWLEEVKIGK